MPNHKSEFDFLFGWMGNKKQLDELLNEKPKKETCDCQQDNNNYPDTKSAKIAGILEKMFDRTPSSDEEVRTIIKNTAILISKIK